MVIFRVPTALPPGPGRAGAADEGVILFVPVEVQDDRQGRGGIVGCDHVNQRLLGFEALHLAEIGLRGEGKQLAGRGPGNSQLAGLRAVGGRSRIESESGLRRVRSLRSTYP